MSGAVASYALETTDPARFLGGHWTLGTYGHLILSERCKHLFPSERKALFKLQMLAVNSQRACNALTKKSCAFGTHSVPVVTLSLSSLVVCICLSMFEACSMSYL